MGCALPKPLQQHSGRLYQCDALQCKCEWAQAQSRSQLPAMKHPNSFELHTAFQAGLQCNPQNNPFQRPPLELAKAEPVRTHPRLQPLAPQQFLTTDDDLLSQNSRCIATYPVGFPGQESLQQTESIFQVSKNGTMRPGHSD